MNFHNYKRSLCSVIAFCLFLASSSCTQNILSVHTDYLSKESLASYYVGTPDPLLQNPPFGQRLILSWNIPKDLYQKLFKADENNVSGENLPPHLEITIRFRTRQEQVCRLPLHKTSGTAIYSVLNEKYCATQGIATYRVRLIARGKVYEEWRHQLWKDLILFEEIPEEPDFEKSSVFLHKKKRGIKPFINITCLKMR